MAARCGLGRRSGAGLSAADQFVDRQSTRLPGGARHQVQRGEGGFLRCDLRHRPHPGRQGAAHGDVRESEDLQDRLPDPAQPGRRVRCGTADPVRRIDPHHVARPSRVLARARRHQAADGRRSKQPTVGHRQLFAGDPGADRRYAGAQGGTRQFAIPARHQHPRADPASTRAELLHPRL